MSGAEARKPAGELAWVSEAPGHWTRTKLSYLVEVISGSTPSKDNEAYWQGTIPWVSPKDMKRALIADAEDHISAEALGATTLRMVPVGSVLMVTRGMILGHPSNFATPVQPFRGGLVAHGAGRRGRGSGGMTSSRWVNRSS